MERDEWWIRRIQLAGIWSFRGGCDKRESLMICPSEWDKLISEIEDKYPFMKIEGTDFILRHGEGLIKKEAQNEM